MPASRSSRGCATSGGGPTFALRVYAKAVKRRDKLTALRQEFDRALEWAGTGREPVPDLVPGHLTGNASEAGNRTAKLESGIARL